MSNINNNYNNERHYNNRRGNFNRNKRVAREPRVNPNEFKARLNIATADLNEDILNEILDVLNTTKFNKISIPLNVHKGVIDTNVDEGDNRVYTIGYIRNYNAETNEFTVIVYSKFTDKIKALGNIAVQVQFTEYNGKLGVITKFNIIPVKADVEFDCEEESLNEIGE